MSKQRILSRVFTVALILVLLGMTGVGVAQGPLPHDPQDELQGDVRTLASPVTRRIPIQGRLTDAAGNPLTGNYPVTFTLYDAASAGTALCTDTDTVSAQNGLFTAYMDNCTRDDIQGDQLWLGIRVGADPEMAPRQPIYPVPYAFSVVPGARVVGEQVNWNAIYAHNTASTQLSYGVRAVSASPAGRGVSGENTGGGHGVYALSGGAGRNGSALYAVNSGASGIAGWLRNDNSTDATLVLENPGSGALLKGFGAGGGEDEIRINNGGSIETKADSYIFIPGTQATLNALSSGLDLDFLGLGQVRLEPSTTGTKVIQFGLVLPGVLYGQPVKVEEVTVFYRTSDAASYISTTKVLRQKANDHTTYYTLVNDTTNRNSTAYGSYSVTPTGYNILSASEGLVSVELELYFASASHSIQIGGVRVRLGHHDLY